MTAYSTHIAANTNRTQAAGSTISVSGGRLYTITFFLPEGWAQFLRVYPSTWAQDYADSLGAVFSAGAHVIGAPRFSADGLSIGVQFQTVGAGNFTSLRYSFYPMDDGDSGSSVNPYGDGSGGNSAGRRNVALQGAPTLGAPLDSTAIANQALVDPALRGSYPGGRRLSVHASHRYRFVVTSPIPDWANAVRRNPTLITQAFSGEAVFENVTDVTPLESGGALFGGTVRTVSAGIFVWPSNFFLGDEGFVDNVAVSHVHTLRGPPSANNTLGAAMNGVAPAGTSAIGDGPNPTAYGQWAPIDSGMVPSSVQARLKELLLRSGHQFAHEGYYGASLGYGSPNYFQWVAVATGAGAPVGTGASAMNLRYDSQDGSGNQRGIRMHARNVTLQGARSNRTYICPHGRVVGDISECYGHDVHGYYGTNAPGRHPAFVGAPYGGHHMHNGYNAAMYLRPLGAAPTGQNQDGGTVVDIVGNEIYSVTVSKSGVSASGVEIASAFSGGAVALDGGFDVTSDPNNAFGRIQTTGAGTFTWPTQFSLIDQGQATSPAPSPPPGSGIKGWWGGLSKNSKIALVAGGVAAGAGGAYLLMKKGKKTGGGKKKRGTSKRRRVMRRRRRR